MTKYLVTILAHESTTTETAVGFHPVYDNGFVIIGTDWFNANAVISIQVQKQDNGTS